MYAHVCAGVLAYMCALRGWPWAAFSSNLYPMLLKSFPGSHWFCWTGQPRSSRDVLLPASSSTGAIEAKHCILFVCGCCGLELSSSCLCVRHFISEPCPQDPKFWHLVERAKRVSPNFMFEGNFSPLINVKYVFLLYTQLVIMSKILGRRHTRPLTYLGI